MINRMLRATAVAVALALLSACVSITPAPAGPYVSGAHQVTLGRLWGDSSAFASRVKQVKMLTIDGWGLNSLYIIDGLKSGDFMVRSTSKERPTPTYRAGMTPTEQVEFVTESIVAMGYQRVETDGLRPAKIGGADGLRADITAKTQAGLEISGLTQIVEVNGKLYIILYLAPTEHYFEATKAEVESIMASARIAA